MKSHALRLFSVIATVVLLLTAHTYAQKGKFIHSKNAIPNRYIVVLDDSADPLSNMLPAPMRADHVRRVADTLALGYGGQVDNVYETALRGFSVEMSAEEAEALSNDPQVKYVEEDFIVSGNATQYNAPWPLDRIDQRPQGGDTHYNYLTTGTGVHAYVIDSGIRASHFEFGGRVSYGADFVNDGQNGNDCNGHGTHVAGILGSSTYGVAKNVSLHNVRVLGCDNRGTGSAILSAINWVTNNRILPAVANFSIGMDGSSPTVESAMTNSAARIPQPLISRLLSAESSYS
ncbi:MAG TPA: S8 family serine peptidase [Pyrinomonadaceae bacterium]|nr:S8 family serine peptidase [Pyrinomonadaceae bacterium]